MPRATRPPAAGRRQEGIALIVVVLALLVLEAAVAGALFVCSLELATTRAHALRGRASVAAESSLAAALGWWDADAIASLRPGDTLAVRVPGADPSMVADARIERLAAGAFLVTGRASVGAGTVPAASAAARALVGWTHPRDFAPSVPGAVVAGGTVRLGPAASVDGRGSTPDCPPADSLAVAAFGAAAGVVAPAGTTPAIDPRARLAGAPPFATSGALDSAAFEHLGPFDLPSLAAAADRLEAGTVAPIAVAGAAGCDEGAPANWGAPPGAAHPCEAFVPIVLAPGDLTVSAGSGQALLLVRGDLTVEPAAELHGVLVVLGRARIHGRVRGALRVAGDAAIEGGQVTRDACAIWRALTRPRALARPFRAGRWRLPDP